jgi:hypothetical protein
MRFYLKLIFSFVFAILQCVEPLEHAHIDGKNSGLLPPSLYSQHQIQSDSNLTDSAKSIEEFESPAITLDHEFQRNYQCAIAAQPANLYKSCQRQVIQFAVDSYAIFVPSPYNKFLPQAPPALS